jgi:hypothetical protein
VHLTELFVCTFLIKFEISISQQGYGRLFNQINCQVYQPFFYIFIKISKLLGIALLGFFAGIIERHMGLSVWLCGLSVVFFIRQKDLFGILFKTG